MEAKSLGVHVMHGMAIEAEAVGRVLDGALDRGAEAVRRDPGRYEAALAEATALLNAAPELAEADRLAMLLAIVDRLASAALTGAIDAGHGRVLSSAIEAGRFDAFLQPESRTALLMAAAA